MIPRNGNEPSVGTCLLWLRGIISLRSTRDQLSPWTLSHSKKPVLSWLQYRLALYVSCQASIWSNNLELLASTVAVDISSIAAEAIKCASQLYRMSACKKKASKICCLVYKLYTCHAITISDRFLRTQGTLIATMKLFKCA